MMNTISILAIVATLSAVGIVGGFGVSTPGAEAATAQVNPGIGNNQLGTTPISDTLIADPNCGHYSSKLIGNV